MMESSWRYKILAAIFGLMGVAIVIQTIRLQIIPEGQAVRQEGDDRFQGVWLELDSPRGQIFDRGGYLLAGNKIVYEVGIELQYVRDAGSIAQVLNTVLEMNYAEALGRASLPYDEKDSVYAVVERGVSAEKAAILQSFIDKWAEDFRNGDVGDGSLAGLVLFPYLHRTYPERDLASSVVGFVNLEKKGYFGIEEHYDRTLIGAAKEVWIPFNPNNVTEMPDIPSGVSLVLTIDREIQLMVEQLLDEAVEQYEAKSATIIVMNPENGEIYAMASTPRIDLNEFWTFPEIYPEDTPFNRAVSQSFEPGSAFKVFTMSAALDSGTVTPETIFFDTGSIEVGGITIANWNGDAWGEQDMIGCLQHSLNVCLAWVGTELGADKFYEYMDAFGFGHFTNIDLAWEATGRLKEPGDGDWYPADLGTNTFGQGISVTPIQMVAAASAIANDGKMVVPHVVLITIDENYQYQTHTQTAGQPITTETARTLNEMLAISLEEEASRALVPGYRLAGKTGTAEIPQGDEGYTKEITNASFIGWGPVDDPKFIVYVWIEEPTPIWGSLTAAPVFSKVVERLVVLLNIPPDVVRNQLNGQ